MKSFIGQVLEVPHGPPNNIFHFLVTEVDSSGEVEKMRLLTKEEIEDLGLTKSKDSGTLKE